MKHIIDPETAVFGTAGLPLFTDLARHDDPPTSRAAAAVIAPDLGKIQRAVLEVFRRHGPMSARQAERLPEFQAYGFSTIRKRISELHERGHLVSCGVDRSGGAPATTYRAKATPPDLAAV